MSQKQTRSHKEKSRAHTVFNTQIRNIFTFFLTTEKSKVIKKKRRIVARVKFNIFLMSNICFCLMAPIQPLEKNIFFSHLSICTFIVAVVASDVDDFIYALRREAFIQCEDNKKNNDFCYCFISIRSFTINNIHILKRTKNAAAASAAAE